MASVSGSSSASNIYNALGAKNKGIGGLATGLDTDSLVAALTAGTKAKIAKQSQDKQLLNWKMTAYRSMSTALRAFQSKSFSYNAATPTSNIMSSSFFNTYKATSSSTKVSVSAGTSAVTGSLTIDKVNQLATAESVSSKAGLSTELLLDVDDSVQKGAFTGQTLKFTFGSSVKTIKLDTLNDKAFVEDGDGNFNFDADAFKDELQRLIDVAVPKKNVYNETTKEYDTLASNVVLTKKADGTFTLDSDSGKITIEADNDILGIKGGDSNRLSLNTKIGAIDQFKGVLQGDVMKFNINGTEISIGKDETLNNLMTKINASNANVRMSYSVYTDEFTLTSKVTGGGENIDMRDVQGNLMNTLFGAQSGNSIGTGYLTTSGVPTSQNASLISGYESGSAEMKALGAKLKNMTFEMTINGVTKTVSLDTTKINDNALKNGTFNVGDVYSAMNKGIENAFGVGTDVTFKAGADGKTVISAADGTAVSLNKGGLGKGGIMDVLGFSEPTGNSILDLDYSKTIVGSGNIIGINVPADKTGSLEMTINGVTKQLEIASGTNFTNFEERLTAAITNAFGKEIAGKIKVTGQISENDDPLLRLEISDPNMSVSMGHGSTLAGKVDMYDMLGLTGTVTNNSKSDSVGTTFGDLASGQNLEAGKLVIDDGAGNKVEVEYSKDMSLQDFMNQISSQSNGAISAGINNGQLTITTKSGTVDIKDYKELTPAEYDEDGELTNAATYALADDTENNTGILKNIFGVTGGEIKTIEQSADMKVTAGKNAEIVVDGRVISQESNTFTINGISITVNEKSGVDDAPIKIDVQSDPEDVVTKIKAWMDDYNALVFSLNTMVNESKNRDYAPLTDEQKSEMTEDQIKTWETEAKKGVLRNDNTLKDILSQLRNTLYEKVEAAGISLYDIGITTKSFAGPNEAGMIEFDKNVSGGGEAKLRAMLTNDPDKVRSLFTSADTGVAVKMNDIINKAANTSSVDQGSLVRLAGSEILTGNNTSILGDKISAIDKFIASLTSRMESEYNRQWKKFSALEVAVQRMSVQSSWLNQA